MVENFSSMYKSLGSSPNTTHTYTYTPTYICMHALTHVHICIGTHIVVTVLILCLNEEKITF